LNSFELRLFRPLFARASALMRDCADFVAVKVALATVERLTPFGSQRL
jgi:hypothetical protein